MNSRTRYAEIALLDLLCLMVVMVSLLADRIFGVVVKAEIPLCWLTWKNDTWTTFWLLELDYLLVQIWCHGWWYLLIDQLGQTRWHLSRTEVYTLKMYLWIVWLVVHDLVRVSCKLGLIFAIDWHDAIYFCAAMLRTFDSVCSWMGPMMNGRMLIAHCRCSARIHNFLHSLILWFISYISWDCTGTIIIALSQLLCLFEMRWG